MHSGRWLMVSAAGGEDEEEGKEEEPVKEEETAAQHVVGSPSNTLPRLPDLPSSLPENHQTTSGASFPSLPTYDDPPPDSWSTVATPGTTQPSDPETAFHLPTAPTTTTTVNDQPLPRRASGGLRRTSTSSEKKGVRFAGMDGEPTSPGASVVSLDSYVVPDGPPPSASGPSDVRPSEAVDGGSAMVDLPTTAASVPSAPPLPPTPNPLPSAPPPTSYPETLDPKSLERCQKHARWAISALDYEDLETARKELRLALDLVEGRSGGR